MLDLMDFLIFWGKNHPILIAAVIVGFFVVTWLLNRRSALDKDNARVVKNLIDGSKDKYKDLRPLN